MSFTRGAAAKIMHGAFDLSSYFRDFDHGTEVDVEDSTTFGKSAKCYTVTLTDATLSLEGLWDGTAAAVDGVLAPVLGVGAKPLTLGLDGLAHGKVVKLMDGIAAKYAVKGSVGGLVEVTAEFQANEGSASGFSLLDLGSQAATANGTSLDNGAGTTNGGAANLHVTSGTGTLTAKVQHSTDNSVWVDLITFTAATGATSEHKRVTGTVNRYVRATWTIATGPFTFTLGFARL
jgi:hypothetical protein